MTKIEWTEATWNPVVGCSIVTPGCTNCYAMRQAARLLDGNQQTPHYAGTTQPSKAGPVWTGKMALAPDRILMEPLRRRKPTMYFVNSMGDLFHDDVPDEWILRVLDVIRITSYEGGSNVGRIGCGDGEHTFQCLTKRSARMRSVMSRLRWDGERLHLLAQDDGRARVLLKNLWLGVSAERQQEADARIPDLLATPAAVRFVSAEPLLVSIDFQVPHKTLPSGIRINVNALTGEAGNGETTSSLDWIIVGGESGPGARPMHPDWARSIRDQCHAAGTPFFFKQWGEYLPVRSDPYGGDDGAKIYWPADCVDPGDNVSPLPATLVTDWVLSKEHCVGQLVARVGKARAGRLLDGRTWDEMPATAAQRVEEMA